jgi:hypothetical protein
MSTMSAIVYSFNISSAAKKLICETHTNEEIVSAHETLSHDDNDDDGPKSNLYDLFLVIKDGKNYNYYYYHRENWYMGTPEEQMYYLEEKVESCELMEITNMDEWFNLSKVY